MEPISNREKTPMAVNNINANEIPTSQQRIHTETESHELSDTKKGTKRNLQKIDSTIELFYKITKTCFRSLVMDPASQTST